MQTGGKSKSWRQTIAAGLHVSGIILADDPTNRRHKSTLVDPLLQTPTYSARKQGPVGAARTIPINRYFGQIRALSRLQPGGWGCLAFTRPYQQYWG